jgi:hypothetical protein
MRTRAMQIAGILAGISILAAAWAQSWEPYAFQGNERFEYGITGSGQEDIVYILNIRETGETSADGEALYEVSYTTQSVIAESQLGMDTAFGLGGGLGFTMGMAIMSPMFMAFMGPMVADLEWEVGERLSLLGMGRVTITGTETIAGREGYVVQFEAGSGDDRELSAEWVIDPELALPLRSRTYEGGEVSLEAVLLSYETH